MIISSGMKDFLVGFPIVVVCAVAILFLIGKMGPAAIIVVVALVILGFIGAIVGGALRDNFGIWR